MFSNGTFVSFITHCVSARNSRSCILLIFALTGALPDTLNSKRTDWAAVPAPDFVDGLRFVYDGNDCTYTDEHHEAL
jgi:hypothetical protein